VARRLALVSVAVFLFALTFFYRFGSMGGTLGGFEDDEFVTLAYAQQMVLGDVPVRDFSENGSPLTHALSAVAIASVGPPLLAEAVLTMSMLGICTAILSCWRRAPLDRFPSRSRWRCSASRLRLASTTIQAAGVRDRAAGHLVVHR